MYRSTGSIAVGHFLFATFVKTDGIPIEQCKIECNANLVFDYISPWLLFSFGCPAVAVLAINRAFCSVCFCFIRSAGRSMIFLSAKVILLRRSPPPSSILMVLSTERSSTIIMTA